MRYSSKTCATTKLARLQQAALKYPTSSHTRCQRGTTKLEVLPGHSDRVPACLSAPPTRVRHVAPHHACPHAPCPRNSATSCPRAELTRRQCHGHTRRARGMCPHTPHARHAHETAPRHAHAPSSHGANVMGTRAVPAVCAHTRPMPAMPHTCAKSCPRANCHARAGRSPPHFISSDPHAHTRNMPNRLLPPLLMSSTHLDP